MNAIVIVAVLLFAAVSAQQSVPAQNCPNFQPMANLESSRLAGEWFAVWSLTEGVQAPNLRCLKSNNQIDANGVFTSNVELISDNKKVSKNEIGTPVDGLRSKLSFINSANTEKAKIVNILATDFQNFAVWGTCFNRENQRGHNIIISSRQTTLAPEHLEQAKLALKSLNINNEHLVPILHQNC